MNTVYVMKQLKQFGQMTLLFFVVLVLTINASKASCFQYYEKAAQEYDDREVAFLTTLTVGGGLVAPLTVFVLPAVATGAALVFVGSMVVGGGYVAHHQGVLFPQNSHKMLEAIGQAEYRLRSDSSEDAQDLREFSEKKYQRKFKRLNSLVKQVTGLGPKDGPRSEAAQVKIAQLISTANQNDDLCSGELMKFKNLPAFIQQSL